MEVIPAQVRGTHIVMTGPISGTVTLPSGETVDVTSREIEVDSLEKAAEVAHQLGLRYYAEGHPDDREPDETGAMVQRPFDYQPPEDRLSDLDDLEQAGVPAPVTAAQDAGDDTPEKG